MPSKIRPPRKPRGEGPKVTIANQDKQIKMLVERVAELQKLNDDNFASAKEWREKYRHMRESHDKLRDGFDKLQEQCHYHRGYIARVKECDRHMFGPDAAT
jgi:hypothetical protein